jgi:hypothetical protein
MPCQNHFGTAKKVAFWQHGSLYPHAQKGEPPVRGPLFVQGVGTVHAMPRGVLAWLAGWRDLAGWHEKGDTRNGTER